ncbi:AAA family ATPase [Arthrobacter sp. NicSoilC12]|uniref:AAA family ATPase n=1 Tax=Arthrobacter sp. NicSoilC12 TaxID=2831001 RepID=UPI001CC55B5B|nr:AAA family ATPase [Arthrobacter sp. NicSoilC12]
MGNRKGGVGKTSVILGLATGLRLIGKKVLVADLAQLRKQMQLMPWRGRGSSMSSTFSTLVRQEPSARPLLQPRAEELKDYATSLLTSRRRWEG